MVDIPNTMAVLFSLILAGGAQTNTGQIDKGFLWARYPNGVCMRIDVSQWPRIPKLETWMNGYDQAELTRQYFIAQGWIVVNTDPNNAMCKAIAGTSTQGLYGITPPPPVVVTPPVVIPPPVITASAPAGTLTDATGGIWTFGSATSTGGNALMLNGTATGGYGKSLQLSNGKVYTLTLQSTWFVWNNPGWVSSAAP